MKAIYLYPDRGYMDSEVSIEQARKILVIGEEYEVEDIMAAPSFTEIKLVGIDCYFPDGYFELDEEIDYKALFEKYVE